jgi:growth factor-regulated tyrosine kinase substrate
MASEPPLVKSTARAAEDDDPDLRAAIEASLREANAPRASAPVVEDEAPTPRNTYNAPLPVRFDLC